MYRHQATESSAAWRHAGCAASSGTRVCLGMRVDDVGHGPHDVRWGDRIRHPHCDYPVMSHLSENEVRCELSISKCQLESFLGQKVYSFAYPHGAKADFNDATLEILRQLGYTLAFTTQKGTNSRTTHPLLVRRYGVPDVPAYVLATRLYSLC